MAIRYCSNTGSNTSPYDTKAKAATTLGTAMTGATAGDEIRFDHTFTNTVTADVNYQNGSSSGNAPYKLISYDFTNDVPAAGGVLSQTSGSYFIFGGPFYIYGMTLQTTSCSLWLGDYGAGVMHLDSCKLRNSSTNSGHKLLIGASNGSHQRYRLTNCSVRFGHASQYIQLYGAIEAHGLSLESGGTSPDQLFNGIGKSCVICNGLDLSAAGAGIDICSNLTGPYNLSMMTFDNVRLPSSWTGNVFGSWADYGSEDQHVEMGAASSGDTRYPHYRGGPFGWQSTETTLVMTGGQTVDGQAVSWRIVTASDTAFPTRAYRALDIAFWNDSTGSSKTFTVEFLHDSATDLTDKEVWIEVKALATSGYANASFFTSMANQASTAADLPNSSVTWTATGMSNPNKQYVSVTLTPQETGPLVVTLFVCKASKTLYVNPAVAVT